MQKGVRSQPDLPFHIYMTKEKLIDRVAWSQLVVTCIGWPSTHIALFIVKPSGASSWVFHLLLALSWAALFFSALVAVITADIKKDTSSNG